MKPIHNWVALVTSYYCVANNPKFRKMKPIHNIRSVHNSKPCVANNPKFRKMKPIHNVFGEGLEATGLRTILNLEK